ncbi:MAG: peptidase C45 [Crocinitomicaceae bacterium]|nr:peptidase C45 [Crocinitomicaceae bacterium]
MVLFVFILFNAKIHPPVVDDIPLPKRTQIAPNHFVIGPNYLKKNKFGVWEMYIEGKPYERGLIYGALAKELIQNQEDIFVAQINQFVPSGAFQQLLKLFIGFFNHDLPKNIPLENQQEIYGISTYFSDQHDNIASKYTRILNYHAAHDIGHALNNYSIVGCTSFAIKGKKTASSNLLIGRNFDFYVGDDFAKDKLLLLLKPTTGYAFVSYSWAGFTGVASGLNEKGLSVTINAAKSDFPTGSRMPISLLAREILQYASTIEEAISIAKKRSIFVSETLMIGSAKDGKAVLIEKSPTKMGVFQSKSNTLICSNHYQSTSFLSDKINQDNIAQSDSKNRFLRVKKLVNNLVSATPIDAANILRDQYSLNNDSLGMGNPVALNQLIAHHSVIIEPTKKTIYFSTNDYQLGKFIGMNLPASLNQKAFVFDDILPEDPFVHSSNYQKFKQFKRWKKKITAFLMFGTPLKLSNNQVHKFISLNGESYVTYELLGDYFYKKNQLQMAENYYKQALKKTLPSLAIQKDLQNKRSSCFKN